MSYPLLEFKKEIIDEVKRVVEVSEEIIEIEVPSEERGDFALPCYSLSPTLEKDPESIAEFIAGKIELNRGEFDQAGPYLNFKTDEHHLSRETIRGCLEKKEDFGELSPKEKKIMIEHTSANPNGPLHVGRARNPIIGDTLARIYEKIGYDVERQYYVNDIGRQMAILTWGRQNLDEEDLTPLQRDKEDYDLVRYYQKASQMLEEDEGLETEIRSLIRAMEEGDDEVFHSLKKNSETVLSGITRSLERLNIHFDSYQHESSFIVDGSVQEVIEMLSKLKETDKEEGALFFNIDDDKIFVTREDGTNLYPARDIAYHIWKAERADELIDILGEDHKNHGEFIKNALLSLDIDPIPEIVFYSFVSFEGEEMSTRKGTYVTLDEFMDTAEEKAREEILKRRDDLSEEVVGEIAEKVGISAVRYNVIRVQPRKPIDFRWDEALNFQGDSAPFIQYSYARTHGILEKAEEGLELDRLNLEGLEDGEVRLLRKIAELPLVLLKTAENNAPHLMARYAYELAAEFNQFYRDYPVLDSDEKRKERLAIVKSFSYSMESVLDTLGMKKTKKM
ncbi:MAG: arginine--tRNA ligase [Candidatus Thermoplasmatota archaeon]|nr:arginine--tRNA ligase [Candidatus Thermoplasmatota archaeon]